MSSPRLPRTFLARLYDRPYLLLALMALFWAGNQVLGRAIVGLVPPITYATLRWCGATLLILPFAWPHLARDWPVLRARWAFLAFLGLTGAGAFNTLQYIGLTYTTALNSLVLNSTGPIAIGLAAFAIFGERMSPMQVAGTCLSMAGVLAIVSGGSLETLAALKLNPGDLLLLVAMAITGVYTAYLRLRPPMHWLSFLFALFLVAGLCNLPLAAWEIAQGARIVWSPFTIAAIAYVAIFPSILAYICFTRGVELIGGVRAGIFLHLIPLFGAALAIGLLGEPPGWHHAAGFALILAGVTLAGRGQTRRV